jgi:hypothetical protein
MKAPRKWRWVTLDDDGSNVLDIWRQIQKPHQTPSGQWMQGHLIIGTVRVCHSEFTKLTGITITKRKPHKVEFTTSLIE